MAKQDSYDRILDKIDGIQTRLEQIEHKLLCMLGDVEKIIDRDYTKDLKARDVPLGTKVIVDDEPFEIIAYSKMGDQVVVLEDEEGCIFTENVNDLKIVK